MISSECEAVFADLNALNNSGQPCEGYFIDEIFEEFESEYEYEYTPPNVTLLCVNDCLGSIADVWSEGYENNCFEEEEEADDFDAEQVLYVIEYTCVMHPDGSYCYDKAVQLVEDDIDCSDFAGMDCCYGWIKQCTSFDFSLS